MSTLHAAAIVSGRAASPGGTLRFSQISNLLKCPVVGLCLTMDEQRRLVRKGGVCVAKAQDFDIHEILVNTCDEDTLLARQVNVLLRKKYELKAAPLRRLDMLSFINHWDAAFATGKYATELWAAATRPDLPLALQKHIFGCVHMDMHEALGLKPKYLEQIHGLQQERTALTEKLRAAKAELTQTHKDLQTLSRQHQTLGRQQEALLAENTRLHTALASGGQGDAAHTPKQHDARQQASGQQSPEQQREKMSAQVQHLEHSLAQALVRAETAEKGFDEAVEERETQRALVRALEEEVLALLALIPAPASACGSCNEPCPACTEPCLSCAASCPTCTDPCSPCTEPCSACTEPCPACGLCPRRILMVGGMTRLESLYRQVVEAKGHEFEYHHGYLGGVHALEASLQKADIVLCPVSCNSHRACLLVKNLCKKYKKTVHMMPSYSLSAVARVLACHQSNEHGKSPGGLTQESV